MVVKTLLDGMKYSGLVSIRRVRNNAVTDYVGGGTVQKVKSKYGYYTVTKSCFEDPYLVLYVE